MVRLMVDVTGPVSAFGERLGLSKFRLILMKWRDETLIVPHSRPTLDEEDVKAVTEVLVSGNIAQGEKVEEFERMIAAFVGTRYGVAVSSGTSALHVALLGLGVKAGDEVIMPSFVCASPYFAVLHAGAVPKVVDISLDDYNINAEAVKRRLSFRTKAIIVPHMFGTPAELDQLLELGVPLIEDCAQALGAEYKGRKVGSFGALSVFSFYATKMITTGEGGMVLTSDREFYDRLIDVRDYDKKSLTPVKYNYKMTDFQAALGLSQLNKLEHFIDRRRKLASVYAERFSEYDVDLPTVFSEKKSVFFRYVLMMNEMERFQRKIKKRGVMCEKPVFSPLHKSLPKLSCPNSDKAFERALSVPLYPGLSDIEIEFLFRTFDSVLAVNN